MTRPRILATIGTAVLLSVVACSSSTKTPPAASTTRHIGSSSSSATVATSGGAGTPVTSSTSSEKTACHVATSTVTAIMGPISGVKDSPVGPSEECTWFHAAGRPPYSFLVLISPASLYSQIATSCGQPLAATGFDKSSFGSLPSSGTFALCALKGAKAVLIAGTALPIPDKATLVGIAHGVIG